MKRKCWISIAVSLLGVASVAVGDGGCSAKDEGPAGGGSNRGGSAASSGGGNAGSGSGSGGGLIQVDEACGIDTEWAMLSPLNMMVMFDRSGSMEDDDKWPNATAALTSFFENPAAAELRVALRFFPHQEPVEGCIKDGCDSDACSQPLVDLGALSSEPAPADSHEDALVTAIRDSAPGGEGDGTPIYAALDGALGWATDHKRAHPDEKTVVIFVTDGRPNGCEEDFDNISQLAADALASPGVPTYAIGLEGSSEDQMDQLAAAGGTMQGIFIDQSATAEQELLSALNTIRGANLPCDFAFPRPIRADQPIDATMISVSFIYPTGESPTLLDKVERESACGSASAWYYDDPQDPARIFLCSTACEAVRAEENAGLQILLGCAGGGGDPNTCAETPNDPACVVD